jgi:hypothetical protein
MRLPNQEMLDAVMLVGAGHQNRLAREWMIRIGNHGFECQKPGTMLPARTKAERTGHAWRR